ncbi:MAG: replication initiation protein RepC [Rhodobacteraceae bacterium]|nr:replication initiation protein RepC [Paracoccaceae bacterium]
MEYTPVTPFRRTVDAVLLKHQQGAQTELPPQGANKWEVLRELSAGRSVYGLSDRDLTVLQALISFYPATILGGNSADLVIHPSNKSICERLNGMPCSTMRRHLAHLVQAGVLLRRDSPNGKRYARRYGEEKIAYGFDLSPLVQRFQEFCEAAEQVRSAEEQLKRLREAVSLMRRDLAGLADYGQSARPDLSIWDAFSDMAALGARSLRRKLTVEELTALEQEFRLALDKARDILEGKPLTAEDMSTKGAQSEQHYQNSNKDSYDSELRFEKAKAEGRDLIQSAEPDEAEGEIALHDPVVPPDNERLPNIPLGLVLASCAEIQTYAGGAIRHWHDLVRAADIVRPMMGVSPSAWDDAKRAMGPEEAAVVIAAMLERFTEIRSHGGYLRHLTDKAQSGSFSCGPMVMALMRREAA